ncbi:hypothetical protein M8R20_46180 [Pseudomonas sp. R2.Fl]|nr:hypothetical protein [Pseudomonas sp. R2.Fl]MCL6714380.1 hypothetical protein [Pseudomonas sp. R2.Fl]
MGGYTPGPWVVYPETNGMEICAVAMAPGLPIRQLIARPVLGENWIANARLIACAPTLLEAAQRVTAAFRSLGESRSLIADFELHKECEAAMLALDAAISRATGEGE